MWDERFDRPDYLFGTEPAAFLKQQAGRLAPGSRILCVADGEGRNSVWLAEQGHDVTAFDYSDVGIKKARALAKAKSVEVDIRHGDAYTWDWDAETYDAVVAIFIQFVDPERRASVLRAMTRAIRPGGLLLLHGYAPRQVDYGTGGPPLRSHMYELPMLDEIFAGMDVLHEADYDAEIDEGPGHSGKSGLIDFIAQKPPD